MIQYFDKYTIGTDPQRLEDNIQVKFNNIYNTELVFMIEDSEVLFINGNLKITDSSGNQLFCNILYFNEKPQFFQISVTFARTEQSIFILYIDFRTLKYQVLNPPDVFIKICSPETGPEP